MFYASRKIQKVLSMMESSCLRSFFIDGNEAASNFRKTMVFHQLYAYNNFYEALQNLTSVSFL